MTPDWIAIAAAITEATGKPFKAARIQSVSRGSAQAASLVSDGEQNYFVKIAHSGAEAMLASEVRGLRTLAAAEVIRTPSIIAVGSARECAFLALEALDIHPLSEAGAGRLGASLAQIHRVTGYQYGAPDNNFIGANQQLNTFHSSWPYFFSERRLRPQLLLAKANGMDDSLVTKGFSVADQVGALFLEYRPQPSLLHGDLWSGNAGELPGGHPVLFDPASYWGDRETDLAMAELFGGFPMSFFTAYRKAWPLDRDYERRKPLYNLYHVLNHFNMFGHSYLGQARRMIDRLASDLRR